MVVGILLAIDIVIMLTWQFADPFYRDTKQMEPIVSACENHRKFETKIKSSCRSLVCSTIHR